MLERRLVEPQQVRQFQVFKNLDDAFIERIRRHARITTLRAREALFRQREPATRSYFCLSGRIKLFRLTPMGNEKIFAIARAADTIFDSISFDTERSYPVNCSAIVASEVLSLEAEFLVDVFHRSQPARNDLFESLITRTDALIDHVEVLSVDKANYRVASFLHDEFLRNGRAPVFRLPSSKKHIASFLSLQPETLSRCLKSLRNAGIVHSSAREIEVLDAHGLEEMVNENLLAA